MMQFQADMLDKINRPLNAETTALGAAYLAGQQSSLGRSSDIIKIGRANDI